MKNKQRIIISLMCAVLITAGVAGFFAWHTKQVTHYQTLPITSGSVSNTITADGTIHSTQEVTLHFQTGGRLAVMNLQEGDSVYQGQTIAQLDTYALQRQLTIALDSYRSTRDSFDQLQSNTQTNIAQTQQKTLLTQQGVSGSTIDPQMYDIIKRITDENQALLDTTVANVDLSNYALQLASLTSPISGILTHADVTTVGQNITTATSFSVADPTQLVFRANVLATDSDKIDLGAQAIVRIAGDSATHSGIISHIYPQKVTLASGQDVYQVDITLDDVTGALNLGKNGTATITSSVNTHAVLVPTWTILNHQSLWVLSHNQPVLRTVTLGNTYNTSTEVLSGLQPGDQIIVNPGSVAAGHYSIL